MATVGSHTSNGAFYYPLIGATDRSGLIFNRARMVMPTAGTIRDFRVNGFFGSVDADDAYTFSVVKNLPNGTTAISCATHPFSGQVNCTDPDILEVAEGDALALRVDNAGNPSNAGHDFAVAMRLVPQ